jgi:hypothetical protein
MITLAATASALVVATPASAQYFPQPQGYATGWHNSGQARALKSRIDAIQRRIEHLDRRNILSDREARRLRQDSRELERRLRIVRQNGLAPQERYDIERRLARLEQRLFRDARDGNRHNAQSGHHDRDRDGRDDRYEDDRGRDRDGRRGRDND